MLKNHLLTALRHLRKQKLYTVINIAGLSVGIACAALVYAFIRSEWTYDLFHPRYETISRIGVGINFRGVEYWGTTPYPLATAIQEEIPGVERTARWIQVSRREGRVGDEWFERDVYMTDPSFADMFHFPLVSGDLKTLLADPDGLIISSAFKDRYFPDVDPVGQTMTIAIRPDERRAFQIKGVLAPLPENSSIRFDLLLSSALFGSVFGEQIMGDWFPKMPITTFVQMRPDMEIPALIEGLDRIAEAHNLAQMWRTQDISSKFVVQPLKDIHFNTKITRDRGMVAPASDPLYAYLLGAGALFVLIIACINFMNIAVGMSVRRTREVGVRKVFGAARWQLMKQFWIEACLLSSGALIIGIGLAELFMPVFNDLTGKALRLDYLTNPATLVIMLSMAAIIGMVSGMYPALVLSGLRPVRIFSGIQLSGGKHWIFKGLVLIQFILSILLITGALLVSRQPNHITRFDLGFQTDRVMFLSLGQGVEDAVIERYRRRVVQYAAVANAAWARATLFGELVGSMWAVSLQGESTSITAQKVSYDFLDVMGIELLQGRNFSRDREADKGLRVIVNERFLETFQITDPVNAEAPFGMDNNPVIIGVVPDFHYMSLRHQIEPMVLTLRPESPAHQVLIKLNTLDDLTATVAYLQEEWTALETGVPFNYSFLNDEIVEQYRSELNMQQIMMITAYIGILLACMGLFGMTALSVARRTKEIGIRKVLGASQASILTLFQREFLGILVPAAVIGWPLAYYAAQQWMQGFAYQTPLSMATFLASGVLAGVLGTAVISVQAVRAAGTDPVETLRSE